MTIGEKRVFLASVACVVFIASHCLAEAGNDSPTVSFQLSAEVSLGRFGGVPYCVDLDGNGDVDILWLQSAGIFSSTVYDDTPWRNKIRDAERKLFCLTATDAGGKVLWQIGSPWKGDRPFLSHGNERTLDCADIDGDGSIEVVCARGSEILIIDGKQGTIERSVTAVSDNIRTICLGHTGLGGADWTILAKNHERAYGPHEYANPTCFYDPNLKLLKTADYLGAGHVPLAVDVDDDGLDEFVVGYCLVDDDLDTKWTFPPVPSDQWDADEMHVDDHCVGTVGERRCILLAASNMSYLLDAATGELIWKNKDVHPQHGQIGHFHSDVPGSQVLIYNKRSDLQLYDAKGQALWRIAPPANFPLGQATPCRRKRFHVFDPTTVVRGVGRGGSDVLIFYGSRLAIRDRRTGTTRLGVSSHSQRRPGLGRGAGAAGRLRLWLLRTCRGFRW